MSQALRITCEKHNPPITVTAAHACPEHGRDGMLFDYSTRGAKTVVLVVRPSNHLFGGAHPGDRVKIDEVELKSVAIRAALWTEAEARKAAEEREARLRASMREEPTAAMRAVDATLAQAMERRQADAERARTTLPSGG